MLGNRDAVWQAIDAERRSLAEEFDQLSDDEWETPSLCEGWRVRDVAAHLTLAQLGLLPATFALLRAGGNMSRMIRDTAIRQARRPATQYASLLRDMAGVLEGPGGISDLEPLIDVLVHGQDMAIPLGGPRPMPVPAAMTAADRVWPDLWPFRAERRLAGFRFAATDCSWSAGQGLLVEGPIAALLLLLTGRRSGLQELSGPGAARLRAPAARG